MSLTLVLVLAICLGVTLALFALLWAISGTLRNAGIIDIFWGPGFAVIAWLAFWLSGGNDWREWLLAFCVTLWGGRLGLHLILRDISETIGEDKRYAAMRANRGEDFHRWSFLNIFMLQAVLMWIISLPIQVAMVASAEDYRIMGILEDTGFTLFFIGFVIEAVSDYHLARFRADPANKGKVLDTGLWALSRHPNYFGDALVWWGIYLIALGATGTWWTIIGPLLMTFLLLRVSGVPMLEKHMMDAKPGYAEYVRRTSAFVLWPPKPRQNGSNESDDGAA